MRKKSEPNTNKNIGSKIQMLMGAFLHTCQFTNQAIHQTAHLQTIWIFHGFKPDQLSLRNPSIQTRPKWKERKNQRRKRKWDPNLGEINQGNKPQERNSECAPHLFDPYHHFNDLRIFFFPPDSEAKGKEEKENPNLRIELKGVWFGARTHAEDFNSPRLSLTHKEKVS